MKKERYHGNSRRRTTRIIILGFLAVVLVGTILLSLPMSSNDGEFTNPIDAAFTAVSATCVTGLVTLDTATHWSLFGQIIILLMIQIGGLGFMTVAVMLSLLIKRAVTPKERMLVAMSYNIDNYDKTGELMRRIWIGTLCIEGAGAAVLATRFIPLFGVGEGIYKSIFHAVSAFCNAGFDLFGSLSGKFSSLSYFAEDPVVNITLMFLIVVGGIGFIVWNDIVNFIVRKKRISVYSKFVLMITLILLLGGTFIFALLEWNNPGTIGEMSIGNKMMASAFQSVTLRTAGFAAIDQAKLTEPAQLISVILMFIGGASGSTAGGVKVGTVGVIVCTIWATALGKRDAVVFKRRISSASFMRAVTVVSIQLVLVLIGTMVVTESMGCSAITALFEASSASATVGISLGITPNLNIISKLVIMALMFLGRVGILTVTYGIMVNYSESHSIISYPDANMLIG